MDADDTGIRRILAGCALLLADDSAMYPVCWYGKKVDGPRAIVTLFKEFFNSCFQISKLNLSFGWG
jgi:hypothetical protein